MNNVHILQELGYDVHYASNFHHPHYGSDNHRLEGSGILCHQVAFVRSPFRMGRNLRAYRQLQAILSETTFDLVHCHTFIIGWKVMELLIYRIYNWCK